MPDDTIWPIVPHTKAKHTILKKYVEAWAPILAQGGFNPKIVFIDGFAGPGKYSGGEDGSPVVVTNAIKNHILSKNFRSTFTSLFIEKDSERSKVLKETLKERCEPLPVWSKYHVINGEFNEVLSGILSNFEKDGTSLAPCLCFVDPFGWSDINYSVLVDFMKYEKAELLITFMAGYLGRFVWDELHMDSIKELFSEEQIAGIKNSVNKEETIVRYFLDNLKGRMSEAGIDSEIYHLAFATYNNHNRLEYFLIYLSKSCAGFKAMKSAMFDSARDGSYKFSDFDFDPFQKTLVDYGGQENWVILAGNELYSHLKTLSENKIPDEFADILRQYMDVDGPFKIPVPAAKNFVNCKTVWKYQNSILQYLEDSHKIKVEIPNRKGKTFPDRGHIIVN